MYQEGNDLTSNSSSNPAFLASLDLVSFSRTSTRLRMPDAEILVAL